MGKTTDEVLRERNLKRNRDVRDDHRRKRLAYLYETVVRHMVGEKAITFPAWKKRQNAHFHYDIDSRRLYAYIEVKGASNTDQIKIFVDQMQKQLDELGFPVDRAAIVVFSYRNRSPRCGKEQKRIFTRQAGNSMKQTVEFCRANTLDAYVIELGMLQRIYRLNGSWAYNRDRRHVHNAVIMNRGLLKIGESDARVFLTSLGYGEEEIRRWLPPRAHHLLSRRIQTTLYRDPISFRLHLLIPNGFKNSLLRHLNGTVTRVD